MYAPCSSGVATKFADLDSERTEMNVRSSCSGRNPLITPRTLRPSLTFSKMPSLISFSASSKSSLALPAGVFAVSR